MRRRRGPRRSEGRAGGGNRLPWIQKVAAPSGATTTPSSFTIPTTADDFAPRIHKNSDNPKNPCNVIYQVKIVR